MVPVLRSALAAAAPGLVLSVLGLFHPTQLTPATAGAWWQLHIALLPISGYEPAGFRDEHMSPLDAVYAFEDLGASVLIPTSYGSFPLSYEPMDAPLLWLRKRRRLRTRGFPVEPVAAAEQPRSR